MSFRLKFIFLTIVFVTLLSVGITKAAWRDAPAGPPNYDELTPGNTQADYKPVNLGDTIQTKSGGLNIMGNVGIRTETPSARLAIGDTGSPGDTIAAYANSSQSTLYAEQLGSGYAIYALGGLNYFSGDVGIGTTGPERKLHVQASDTNIASFEGDNDGLTIQGNAAGMVELIGYKDSDNTYNDIYIRGSSTGIFLDQLNGNVGIGTTGGLSAKLRVAGGGIKVDGASEFYDTVALFGSAPYLYAGSSSGAGRYGYLWWDDVNKLIRMGHQSVGGAGIAVDNAGNVGIGEVSPTAKLHLVGVDTTSSNFALKAVNSSASPLLFVRNDGNVGIGTTGGLSKKLTVAGEIQLNGYPTGLYLGNEQSFFDDGGGGLNITSGAALTLSSGGNIILTGGNVGIGATGLGYKLDVAGDVNITGTYRVNGVALSTGGISGSGTAKKIPIWTSASGIGDSIMTQSAMDNDISVAGSVTASAFVDSEDTNYYINPRGDSVLYGNVTAAAFYVSSDARLKKNVETLSGSLEKLGRARGVSYDLASGQGARQIGVIAQELEQEFPELVKTDDNGYKAVAYDRLSAVLIEAIKELKAQNQALQQRLDHLEKKW